MANSYVDPNFNIDTDTNVAGLTALKGGAPDADDKIYVYNSATLTAEGALTCLLISVGETSAGAAPDGQRRGYLVFSAGVTVTFTGNATATLSGIKSSPASAPGTASESKSSSLTINGTSASPTIFTNSAGAYSATARYCVNWVYGVFGTMGVWQLNYPSTASSTPAFYFPSTTSVTTATSHNFGTVSHVSGVCNLFVALCAPGGNAARTITFVFESLTIDNSANTSAAKATIPYYDDYTGASATSSVGAEIKAFKYIPPAGVTAYAYSLVFELTAGVTMYFSAQRASATDIRPTTTVPTGLAIADAGTSKELSVTWDNAGSYVAGDKIIIYNAVGDGILAVFDATVGSGTIGGLTNGTAYTVYAKATSDNYVCSVATANAGPATPTAGATPTFSGITSLVDNADGTLTAGWGAATGEDEFEIHVKPTAAITAGEIASRTYLAGAADADKTSQRICNTYSGAKLTAATDYYVAVVAINGAGQDGNAVNLHCVVTNPAAVTTPAPVVPGGGEALLGVADTLVFTMPASKKGFATVSAVNVDAAAARTVDLYRVRAGGSIEDKYRICAPAYNLPVNGAPLDIIVKDMMPGDEIRGLCSSANKVLCVVTTCEETIG